jgi:hypothetical protein
MATSSFLTNDIEIGWVEYLNGHSSQQLVNPTTPFAPSTVAGRYMTVYNGTGTNDLQGTINGARVPGYRGYMSIMLYANGPGNSVHWMIGSAPQIAQHSFEASSFMAIPIYSQDQGATAPRLDNDENPVTVIYDILTRWLGFTDADIDGYGFYLASIKLFEEKHGYSRAVEQDIRADELLGEILEQIDAVMYEDQGTGLIKIKLLRNDFDPSTIPVISRDRGHSFEPKSAGWQDIPNKVRVVFPDRAKDYQDNSITAHNLANFYATGKAKEVIRQYPGCCNAELAGMLAARDLAAVSRPLMAGQALVDRSFLRVNPGDVVKVNWNDPDIGGLIFRVVNVDRGERENGMIKLDLIQDYYYTWRSKPPLVDLIDHYKDILEDQNFLISVGP